MANEQKNTEHKLGARVAIIVAAVAFIIYLVNMLVGKANIVYEKDMFHIGDIGEFLIMFVASIAFIVAALFREADWKSNNPETNNH